MIRCEPPRETFDRLWASAEKSLSGPPPRDAERLARLEQWRQQEWHDWFRWRLTRKSFDWSKPIWFLVLTSGLVALIGLGVYANRWEWTAGGVVAWFTIVNLGFFAYLGLSTRLPCQPVPGPFLAGPKIRGRMGLYPAGYDGRTLARLWLRIPVSDLADPERASNEWTFELTFPDGFPSAFENLVKEQQTFRMQRGDAPAMAAVCEIIPIDRDQIDAGQHPIKVVAWRWDTENPACFERPRD